MKTLKLAFGLAAALLVSTSFAIAQERLRPIGEITYEPEPAGPERGVFELKPRDQELRSFRIEMDSGEAEIRDVRVRYADGGSERVRIRQSLRDGQSTALIRLQEDEPVKSIEVTYVPKGAVTMLLQAEGRRPPPPPPPPPVEWAELGCKNVGFLADRDSIPVSLDERYRALRLRSTGFDINLIEMGVRYGNGQRDVYSIRSVLPNGSRTSPIELRGERRRIQSVDLLYNTNTISNRKTRLCVDGLRWADNED